MAPVVGQFRSRPGGGGTVLVLDRAKIAGFALPGGMSYRFVNSVVREIVFSAKSSLYFGHGYDTGALQRSVDSSVTPSGLGQIQANVRATAKHALFYHEGTRPHVIQGKRYGYLKFPVPPHSTNFVRKPKVFHPGFRGHPFLRQAMEATLARRGIT